MMDKPFAADSLSMTKVIDSLIDDVIKKRLESK